MLGFGIRALQVVLLMVSAYLAYGTVSPLVGAAAVRRPELPDVAAPSSTVRDLPRYEVISSRNLFRGPSASIDAAPLPEVLRETRINAILIGTLVSSRGGRSVATLEDKHNRDYVTVGVGDDVLGAKVERIEQRRVVLLNQGRFEQLTMEDFEALQRASLSPAEKKNRMVGRSPAARLQGLRRMFERAQEGKLHERLAPVVENLRKQAQLTDDRNEKGIYLGLEVSALKPGSRLAKAGVRNGDRIVAINTIPITYQGRLKPNVYPMFVPGRPFEMKLLDPNGKRRVVKVEREPGSIN